MLLNVKQLPLIWEVATRTNMKALKEELDHKYGDQLVLRASNQTRPEMVGFLPNEWALSLANNGLWTHTDHLVSYRPQVGMFHFNGGGKSKESYWGPSSMIPTNPETFGIVTYYINLPWPWALFIGESQLRDGDEGYSLTFQYIDMENSTTLGDKDTVKSGATNRSS